MPEPTILPPASDDASATCCAVLELRQYTLHSGRRDELIALFEREFVETQEAAGIRLVGTFRDLGDPDRFVWLRGFPGMAARRAALEAFYGGPCWRAHRDAANATMVDSDDVRLLRPLRAGAGFAADAGALPPRGSRRPPRGLVEARIATLEAAPTASQLRTAASMAELQRGAGAVPLAVFRTEPARNSFPRLPVREGESVLVWFSQFRDRADYARYRAALEASPRWQAAWRALGAREPRPSDVLLLAPTPRSRLPRFEPEA